LNRRVAFRRLVGRGIGIRDILLKRPRLIRAMRAMLAVLIGPLQRCDGGIGPNALQIGISVLGARTPVGFLTPCRRREEYQNDGSDCDGAE